MLLALREVTTGAANAARDRFPRGGAGETKACFNFPTLPHWAKLCLITMGVERICNGAAPVVAVEANFA